MMKWIKKENSLFIIGIALYLASLALPGIVYEPSLLQNPKYIECAAAMEKKNPKFIGGEVTSIESLEEYCAGYNVPQTKIQRGYLILLIGWLGMFLGSFAWYANVSVPFLMASFFSRSYQNGMIASVAALFLGLHAFAFHTLPLDEAGVNELHVDYFGIGYYFWMLSFIFAFCHFLWNRSQQKFLSKPISFK